jgi:hypothetical protein
MTTMPASASQGETPDVHGAYPRLSPEQIEALAALGGDLSGLGSAATQPPRRPGGRQDCGSWRMFLV